jgi:hypothetical protein
LKNDHCVHKYGKKTDAAGGSEKRDCAHATAPGEEIWVIKSLFLVSGRNKNCHSTDVFNMDYGRASVEEEIKAGGCKKLK